MVIDPELAKILAYKFKSHNPGATNGDDRADVRFVVNVPMRCGSTLFAGKVNAIDVWGSVILGFAMSRPSVTYERNKLYSNDRPGGPAGPGGPNVPVEPVGPVAPVRPTELKPGGG